MNKNIVNNNKGFTLIEVMVGVGLAAVVTMAVVATQVSVSKDQVDLRNQLDQSIDTMLAERILFNDFNTVEPSYNNITLKDDSQNNFFDYYPDVPANSIKGSLARTITMSAVATTQSMSIIAQDMSAGPSMNYDPTAAYSIGKAPADFNSAATLTYVSPNQKNWISNVRVGFWVNGMTLMFDTMAKLRPLLADGSLNMQVPPRSPTYVGAVNGLALQPVGEPFASLLIKTQPDTGTAIPDVDTFLRTVPSVGGGQSIVRLRAVKVLQYVLEPDKSVAADCYPNGDTSKTPYYHSNFYKVTYKGVSSSNKVLLADKVCNFIVTRDSILKRMIYFKINKPQDLKSTGTQTAGL